MLQDIVIDLDDDVIDRLKLKAELKGRSLEEELRAISHAADPAKPQYSPPVPDRTARSASGETAPDRPSASE